MRNSNSMVLNEREDLNMSTKQRSRLVNFNRTLIFALTLAGLLMDGFQYSDLPFTLGLVVWLWLTVIARMEVRLLSRVSRLSASGRNFCDRQHQHLRARSSSIRRARGVAAPGAATNTRTFTGLPFSKTLVEQRGRITDPRIDKLRFADFAVDENMRLMADIRGNLFENSFNPVAGNEIEFPYVNTERFSAAA